MPALWFRFRKKASSTKKAAAAADATNAVAGGGADGGALVAAGASPDHDSTPNGSKDDSFFEARPWLDSDTEDDFHSVRGDFTPSKGTTPDHQRGSPFTGRVSVDRLEPSLNEKKQRLLELLQEKQQYDEDIVTDVGSEMENGVVHAEEYMKSSRNGAKVKKSSKAGCFPSSICKINFRGCRKKRKEQKTKVN
ncbi:hypothetical protein GUJ93_ZPchr0015g6604 [Zizania palustris]|uniref:Uncharacterized protein n=1 Tax=Zizania palustris TaxID=103762 RepID=A0A8J5TD31_ZIZPA|nr:hypothetical protein GUJ93_ZPchr0015g6604 [Zizania palustris]